MILGSVGLPILFKKYLKKFKTFSPIRLAIPVLYTIITLWIISMSEPNRCIKVCTWSRASSILPATMQRGCQKNGMGCMCVILHNHHIMSKKKGRQRMGVMLHIQGSQRYEFLSKPLVPPLASNGFKCCSISIRRLIRIWHGANRCRTSCGIVW